MGKPRHWPRRYGTYYLFSEERAILEVIEARKWGLSTCKETRRAVLMLPREWGLSTFKEARRAVLMLPREWGLSTFKEARRAVLMLPRKWGLL